MFSENVGLSDLCESEEGRHQTAEMEALDKDQLSITDNNICQAEC